MRLVRGGRGGGGRIKRAASERAVGRGEILVWTTASEERVAVAAERQVEQIGESMLFRLLARRVDEGDRDGLGRRYRVGARLAMRVALADGSRQFVFEVSAAALFRLGVDDDAALVGCWRLLLLLLLLLIDVDGRDGRGGGCGDVAVVRLVEEDERRARTEAAFVARDEHRHRGLLARRRRRRHRRGRRLDVYVWRTRVLAVRVQTLRVAEHHAVDHLDAPRFLLLVCLLLCVDVVVVILCILSTRW